MVEEHAWASPSPLLIRLPLVRYLIFSLLQTDVPLAGQVKLTYTGGDDVDDPNPVNDGPRITVITISCGTGDMSNVAFTDASVNKNPNRHALSSNALFFNKISY